MGSSSSKFRKHLQAGDEVQALQLYRTNTELRKALDPNCSYGDSHQHETPLHLAAKHGMQTLLGIFLFSKGGNPKKTNARKETCLHCVCMETNCQSIHVGRRRADCLNYLLKWRGATLAEGQMEKLDLAAQDEKLNTALHYAAASGLSQCVEILIQHGAPLFIENEDHMTPCDTAEKNGHARIALYLESKMVFSNDEESQGAEDIVSMPPVEEYSGLRPQDLQEAKDHLLVETADMLSVPLFTAEALLRNHEWSREMLLEAWMNDPVSCCEKCGVIPPSTLFSEKPQVQENLASPLSSPLHTTPSSQDAECKICSNTFLIVDEPVHMTCTHLFCKDCWERYLNVKIQEGDAHHITCPAYDCTMLVPIDIIERIVSRDMTLRYLQFDIKAFVDSNPDMKWCPYPSCGRAVKLPDLDLGSNQGIKRNKIPSDTSRGVDCGVGHYFCWECLEESHEPCSCENWSKWFQKINEIKPETLDGTEQETELAANCLWLVTNSKPCPNCKSPIQKNEGCNHMKCSKCKYDFCWVCLEQWKRHNSSTGGYFKCNRYEVLKQVEEQSAQLVSEAEIKSRNMQELNRFVHYYTRFKNHENSYKLEEPLLKTVKDKMMKLAEAVTDIATAHAETTFVEDAVQQLLKARRVLKCSYVYGFYLDGPGYKKIVFEFMQTELEECIEVLSQMVNRLYLRTPRRKIVDQAHFVQRKRLEFITAISKGLVPPETPPHVRKSKMKRKISGGEADDEDLHRAIVASIQEINPSNPWIKDASGRHTNVVALLEWPSDESDQSEEESELRAARESIGKCHRLECNKVRVKNPRTNEHHDYCSRWCMQVDKEDQKRKDTEGISEIVLDEHMELLRALEMSRLQYLRDNGLLHVPDSPDTQQSSYTKITKTHGQNYRHRPRSNSADQETIIARKPLGLNSMKALGIELQRFHELSSTFPGGERDDINNERKMMLTKSKINHCHKLNQSSRFDECGSTVVTRVPNKSVEDLYCLDQTTKSSDVDNCQTPDQPDETNGSFNASLLDNASTITTLPCDILTSENSTRVKMANLPSSASDDHLPSCSFKGKGVELIGSTFGAIKDISVSNIHSNDNDKTTDFLSKDLASIFASWDSNESENLASSPCEFHVSTDIGYAWKPLTLEDKKRKGISGKGFKSNWMKADNSVSRICLNDRPYSTGALLRKKNGKSEEEISWSWVSDSQLNDCIVVDENISDVELHSIDLLRAPEDFSTEILLNQEEVDGDFREISLLEITENLLHNTADADFHTQESEKDRHSKDVITSDTSHKPQGLSTVRSLVPASGEEFLQKSVESSDFITLNDRQRLCESIVDRHSCDNKQNHSKTALSNREKISHHKPRTSSSLKEVEEDTSIKWLSEARKTCQNNNECDSNGACTQSLYTSLSESNAPKGKIVTVAFTQNAEEYVYKVPQNMQSSGEKKSDNHNPESKLSVNRLEAITSSPSLQQESNLCETTESDCSNISCEDTSITALSSITSLDMSNIPTSNIDVVPRVVYQGSSVSSTQLNEHVCFPSLVFPSLTPDAMITSTGATSSVVTCAEEAAKSETIFMTYSLRRNISCDRLLQYSSCAEKVLESENHINEEDTKIICGINNKEDENVITASALITDACEIAIFNDSLEEASSVLPSDNQQLMNRDQVCEEVDEDDLHSVFV